MKTKLIINADDFGYSRAVNYGIYDSYQQGILTSATLMATMPGFEHAAMLSKQMPNLGIGVHLVLTTGDALIKSHKYIAKEGHFFSQHEYRSEAIHVDADELYNEWKAQIEKVIAAGITPTHFDSHHGAHFYPGATEVFIKLATEYQVPVRKEYNENFGFKSPDYFVADFDEIGLNKEKFSSKAAIEAYFTKMLKTIKKYDSVEIMTHPGYVDALVPKYSSYTDLRYLEVEYLIDSVLTKAIAADEQFILSTFADL